jgi:GH25 family lysozyme M1 (1,4-beta-N-acetylmuramidase)
VPYRQGSVFLFARSPPLFPKAGVSLMPHRSVFLRLVAASALVLAIGIPVAAEGSAASAAAAKAITGPDVASYQHPHPTAAHPHGQPINWTDVAKSGKKFAIVKATEGTDYVNPYFAGPYADDYADAAAAGLVHGSYHFARPALPVVSSAVAQAKLFANTIGPVTTKATLPPALDLEVTGGLNPGQLVTWAQTFLLEMRTLTGRTPMLYTYPSFWDNDLADPTALARYPMWMANFGASTAPTSDLWQYTDSAHIKGIQGGVDVSRFEGTSGFPWSTLSNGTKATPWTPSAPAAPISAHASASGGAVTVSWLPGDTGTSPVTSYRVTASPGGSVVTVSGTSLSATMTGLKTNTAYTFTVTAINSVGTGTPTKPTLAVTRAIPTTLAASVQSSLRFGASLPLKATLLRADTHAALAHEQVLIYYRRLAPATGWVQVRKLSTDSAGLASTVLHPTRSAELEAVFPGAKGVQRSDVFENFVVRPTVTAAFSETLVSKGTPVTMSGSVSPFVAGQQVVREGYFRGGWHVVATSKVGTHGKFSFTMAPMNTTVGVYRIRVAPVQGRAAGYSKPMTLYID